MKKARKRLKLRKIYSRNYSKLSFVPSLISRLCAGSRHVLALDIFSPGAANLHNSFCRNMLRSLEPPLESIIIEKRKLKRAKR